MSKSTLKNKKRKQKNLKLIIAVCLIICSYLVSILLIVHAFHPETDMPVPADLYNSLGIACQVVTSICTCVLSILQISFTLQNDKFLGIPVRALYRMRIKPRFGFMANTLISLGFIIITTIGYILGSLYSCVVAAISSIVFCLYLVITETPYLSPEEKTVLNIVRDRLVSEHNNSINANDYQTVEVTELLEALIKNKNLIWTYERLKKQNCVDFNRYLLYRLIDVQANIAFNLDKIESLSQLSRVTDELLDTVCAMVSGNFNIVGILGENPEEYLHHLTRVLFRLLDNEVSKAKTITKIADMTQWGSIYNKDQDNSVKSKLFFSVITILILRTVEKNDFSLIREIKKALSISPYCLRENGITARIFAMVSFVLYYLSKIENSVPKDIKNNIDDLVQNSYIEDNCKVLSWKALFNKFGDSYSVSMESFLLEFSNNKHYYEFSLLSCDAYYVTLTNELAFDWYMATYLNFARVHEIDYNTFFPIDSNPWIVHHLKVIERACYTDNRQFVPSERIKEMAEFYSMHKIVFSAFSVAENHRHQLRDYIDSLRKKEIENKIASSLVISNQEISDHFQPKIEAGIKSTFGFNERIDVSNEKELYFALLTERCSDAINYDECIIDWAINSILYEIGDKAVKKYGRSINTRNNFAQSIRQEVIEKDIEYATSDTTYYAHTISDDLMQNEYLKKIKSLKSIGNERYLFPKPTFILKGGFSFNCKVRFKVRNLTAEEIDRKVDEHRRTDGQYVFEGTFLTREELMRMIGETHIIVEVVFLYKIIADEGSIIYLSMIDDDVDNIALDNEDTHNCNNRDDNNTSDNDK